METEILNQIETKNIDLKQHIDFFSNIFNDLKNDSQMTSQLLDFNLKTEFAQIVDDAIRNPLKVNFESMLLFQNIVSDILNKEFCKFFETNRKYIVNVYKSVTNNNFLHYTILLNDFEKRSIFSDYWLKFHLSSLGKYFTLVFQTVPLELHHLSEDFGSETQIEKII